MSNSEEFYGGAGPLMPIWSNCHFGEQIELVSSMKLGRSFDEVTYYLCRTRVNGVPSVSLVICEKGTFEAIGYFHFPIPVYNALFNSLLKDMNPSGKQTALEEIKNFWQKRKSVPFTEADGYSYFLKETDSYGEHFIKFSKRISGPNSTVVRELWVHHYSFCALLRLFVLQKVDSIFHPEWSLANEAAEMAKLKVSWPLVASPKT